MSAPLVMHTIKVQPRSWRCSCGQKLGVVSAEASVRSADAHAAWHAGHREGTSTEYGALHNKAQR